ncbi:hypothetical protein ACFOHK_04005 [Falsigemmobacter intermedius]|uniref:Uncharacterized protein n=1 Tax=Falsigemmobacter intermedius TaxID=1553448 RepID=A0A3S3UBP3_9RHOB|nr:hypothetical protein [Falsigemmobacter intermedius]RWY43218.1 hypothetical protein EP867_04705 [Falsigemmobacter intermedius]
MMLKIAGLMLLVLAALAVFGRVRLGLPGARKPRSLAAARKCRSCGRPAIGKGRCGCGAPEA